MQRKQYLIVGGSSVSGQAIIQGLREEDANGFLISTTSGDGSVAGADATIQGIDLSDASAARRMIAGTREHQSAGTLDTIVYVPARGMVGIPASAATRAMVDESIDYSIRPMLELMRALKPRLTVCLSGFITMESMLDIYGAMTYTKLIMEDLATRHADRFKVIRLGMFPSKSVRGIAILVQKGAQRKTYPELGRMAELWRASGEKKFQDWMWNRNWEFEESVYREAAASDKAFRPTTADDIQLAARRVLSEPAPILNVLGDWVWTDDRMPAIPGVVQERGDFLKTDLDAYFRED